MALLLTALSGIAWTIVYIDSIRVGFQQKTYAMPIAALGLNIAWEWTYAVRDLATDPQLQAWVNLIWALADVVILTTFFRYGRSEFPGFVSRSLFITSGIVIVTTSFLIQWLFIAEFGTVGTKAAQYSAFLQNLLMSGLFIAMFVARRGPRGQTLLIAIAKWIGTLAPTILFGFIYGSLFIIGIGLLCGVFDLAYIGLLIWAKRDPAAFPITVDHAPVAQYLRRRPARERDGLLPARGLSSAASLTPVSAGSQFQVVREEFARPLVLDLITFKEEESGVRVPCEPHATEKSVLVPKPAGLTFEQAAAVNMAGMTALQGLRDKGQIKAGQRVLINGAS